MEPSSASFASSQRLTKDVVAQLATGRVPESRKHIVVNNLLGPEDKQDIYKYTILIYFLDSISKLLGNRIGFLEALGALAPRTCQRSLRSAGTWRWRC